MTDTACPRPVLFKVAIPGPPGRDGTQVPKYTVANLPSAGLLGAGYMAFATDGNGGAGCNLISDGINWRRVSEDGITSYGPFSGALTLSPILSTSTHKFSSVTGNVAITLSEDNAYVGCEFVINAPPVLNGSTFMVNSYRLLDNQWIAFSFDGAEFVPTKNGNLPFPVISGYSDLALDPFTGSAGGYIPDRGNSNLTLDAVTGSATGTISTPLISTLVEHWQTVGQSLSIGANGGAALTTNPVSPRAAMIQLNVAGAYGPRPMEDQNPADDSSTCDPTKLIGLTPLVEAQKGTFGETHMSGFVAQYIKGGINHTIAVDSHGLGSTPYQGTLYARQLGPMGIGPFANGMVFQAAVKKYAAAAGVPYKFAGLLNIHGETDSLNGRGRANYLADLQDWIKNYNKQSRDNTAWSSARPMFVSQLGTNLRFNSGTNENGVQIALAQMDAQILGQNIYLVGPRYMLPVVDGTHSSSAGYRWLGEMMGKVVRKVMRETVAWKPLYPASWTRTGVNLDITFNVPVAPLVFDTSIVSDPGNGGFSYIDDNASGVTVTSATITGPTTVRVVLSSSTLGTNPRFRIAAVQPTVSGGPTSAGRSTLRDSDSELGALSGLPLYNYACLFEGAIT